MAIEVAVLSSNELSTDHRYSLGVKAVVIKKQWQGVVHQWQAITYDGHRSEALFV